MSDPDRPDARRPRPSGAGAAAPSGGAPTGGKGSGKASSKGSGRNASKGSGRNAGKGRGTGSGKGASRRDDADDPVARLTGPLQKVLARLPETQRKVLELRMGLADGHPHDIADTARTLGMSLSEARDIEQRAFEHIREAIPLQQLQRFLDR